MVLRRLPGTRLLCLDLLILLDVDMVIGLEDTDFVVGEFDAKIDRLSDRYR